MKKVLILVVMGLLVAFTGGAAGAVVGVELEEGMDMVITSIDMDDEMEPADYESRIVTPEVDNELGEGSIVTYKDGDEIVIELYDGEGEGKEVEKERNWLPISAGIGGILLAGSIAFTIRNKK